MATDSNRANARRKPTRRGTPRKATAADSHYSKLTQKSSAKPTGSAANRGGKRASRRPATRPKADAQAASTFENLVQGARERVYGKRGPRRRRSGNATAAFIGIAVIAAFMLGGLFFWRTRSVTVDVNGESTKIRVHSSLESLFEKTGVDVQPGNYVSVGGNVLEEGTGYPFSANVDGAALSTDEIDTYRIKGGESIQFGNGENRLEDYDVEYREVQPKLVFQGSWGSVTFVKQWGKIGQQEIRTGKQSHETADGDWKEEVKDCIIVTKNLVPENGEKLVALTFDDGPSVYTERILEILARYDAKATFFNLSPNEETYPEVTKKVVESGCQICSHTNQHLDLTSVDATTLQSEISSAHDTILQVSGTNTSIIRPPYGSFSQTCWMNTQGTVSASILWNQDSLDWTLPGAEAIASSALENIQPGSVILMHDGGGEREQGIEALPQIIENLQASGYRLVTINELLASDPEVPDDIANGDATLPEGCIWPTELGESTINVG